MRSLSICLGFACLIGLPVLAAAQEPVIDLTWDPRIPEHVENPGGEVTASCIVDPGGTVSQALTATLTDSEGNIVFFGEFPGATEYYLQFFVPSGAPDGIYRYTVEYIPVDGPSISAEGQMLVAGSLTGLCVIKFFDENGNGEFDDEELLEGWEMCYEGPSGAECELTDANGTACWFGIDPGLYTVCETLQGGLECTNCDDCCCITIDVAPDEIAKILIGNNEAPIPVIDSSWGEIKAVHRP